MSNVSPDSLAEKSKEIIEVRLNRFYQLRKTLIFKRPRDYAKLDLNAPDAHLYTRKYKKDVMSYWNSTDLSVLNYFSPKEIRDITNYCKRNKRAVLCDTDPLVTFF